MIAGPTLDKIEDEDDYEFHVENVLLISESGTCYGNDLEDLLAETVGGRPGHNTSYDYSPRDEGINLLSDASREDKIRCLENSLWLVEASCFERSELSLKDRIQDLLPKETQVILWDAPNTSMSEADLNDLDQISMKILRVETETSLRTAIRQYFTRSCNLIMSTHCIEWNNAAVREQRSII